MLVNQARRPADALRVTEEAVAVYRALAATGPDRFRPGLARSMTALASILAAHGREDDPAVIRADAEQLQG